MCTVSVIPIGDGYRLVTNRDEQRDRAPAEAPEWREDGARWIGPRDPVGGGTWVGAAEQARLTLCLLNVNIAWDGTPGRSRGEIIPELIASPDAESAIATLRRMDLGGFAPFRLVAVGPDASVIDARWDAEELVVSRHSPGPRCYASSGLGDERVEPRFPLFADIVARDPTPTSQDAYHRHVWAGREEISVLMTRDEARTVSIATVEVGAGVGMRYEEIAET